MFYNPVRIKHCYLWKDADNFKIEIICLVVNTSHKFAIYKSNVKIQKLSHFETASTPLQYQWMNVLQIQFAYMIQISAILWSYFSQSVISFHEFSYIAIFTPWYKSAMKDNAFPPIGMPSICLNIFPFNSKQALKKDNFQGFY